MTERFKQLLGQLNLSASEFADKIGVQRSSVSHVLSGRNKPSIDFLEKILIAFPDIDATWLISGRKGSSIKTIGQDTYKIVNEDVNSMIALDFEDADKKPPAPSIEEPVAHIIIVYKNNSFRFLYPSEK